MTKAANQQIVYPAMGAYEGQQDGGMPEFTRSAATECLVNAQFNEAALLFKDGSFLRFAHKGLNERWAKPSADDTIAGEVCRALHLFRLNAKHLQLFFEDGTDVEFLP